MSQNNKYKYHKTLKPTYRDQLPVSMTVDQRTNKQVPHSLFGDNLWSFRHELKYQGVPESAAVINWDFLLDDEHMLSKDKVRALTVSCKCILYSLKFERIGRYRAWGIRSLVSGFTSLKSYARWMSKRGIYKFSDMKTSHWITWRLEINEQLSFGTRSKVLTTLNAIHQQREMLDDAMEVHPWPSDTVGFIGSFDGLGQTPAIPMEVAQELFNSAFSEVENSYQIIKNHLLWQKLRLDPSGKRYKGNNINESSRKFTENTGLIVKTHTDALADLRTASVITILGLSGMRIGEYLNLKTNCMSVSLGRDGTKYYWVSGHTFKLHELPHHHSWVVPKIVHRAIKIIRILNHEYRLQLEKDYATCRTKLMKSGRQKTEALVSLETLGKQRGGLHLRSMGVDPLNRIAIISDAGIKASFKHYIESKDIRKLDGELWPLSAHQFRRTFARMIAASAMGDLRYLRKHLDHWTVEMTTHYAKGGQEGQDLFNLVKDEALELKTDLTESWMDSEEPLSGGAASRIKEIRERDDFHAISDKRAYARVVAGDVTIRATGHSFCLSSNAGCGGRGLYDSTLCVDCNSGIIDKSFGPFWQAVRQQQIELLGEFGKDLGDSVRIRCERHLEKAETVLKALGILEAAQ